MTTEQEQQQQEEEKSPFIVVDDDDLVQKIQKLVETTTNSKIESLQFDNLELKKKIDTLEERIKQTQASKIRLIENRVVDLESSFKGDGRGGGDDNNNNNDNTTTTTSTQSQPLSENTFSLIYTAPVNSVPFYGSILFVLFQFIMPLLALFDQIYFEYPINPFLAPPDVSYTVRIAGFLSLVLSVALFWDLMDAVEKLAGGPPPSPPSVPPQPQQPIYNKNFDTSSSSAATIPAPKVWKFYLAFTLQFLVGAFFQLTIFTLVVQSTTIIGMFLNFAALQFITEVDDIAFALAAKGYLGKSMKYSCMEIENYKLPLSPKKIAIRRICYFFITFLLLGAFFAIFYHQQIGTYQCKRLEVQFGDGFISILPLFSGFYNYEGDTLYTGRPIYRDEKTGKAVFRYCRDNLTKFGGYWVFNFFHDDIQSVEAMCDDWYLRSPHTQGFDLLTENPKDWLTKKAGTDKLEFGVEYIGLYCQDCDDNTCSNGSCENNICVCDKSEETGGQALYYGANCEFKDDPCEVVEYDHRTSAFSGSGFLNDVSSTYQLLKRADGDVAQTYGRPIYAHFYPPYTRNIDVLMFMGRRYFILKLTIEESDLVDYLEGIHPYYDWMNAVNVFDDDTIDFNDDIYNKAWFDDAIKIGSPLFVSGTIDIDTSTDTFSPIGLSWSLVDDTQTKDVQFLNDLRVGQQIDTVLLCAKCSKTHPCLNVGKCGFEVTNNTCTCLKGFEGPLCEKNVIGDA